ncbi:hypothetical protein P154DRAFT_521112 [Amniculicola lignicola CBS 123094]|uniref:Uncharacterized protein n=1 Tax=Amniculicola lignicola CBS 123094 TaxID=1392246 RepID=A0A6A5WTA1_9PLEO|nr:hypothetical protein P154DRAFT_521112 [Amniculicola lignicola CBS 123094]
MQFFATHLLPSQQRTRSSRASQYKPARKRRRDAERDDESSGSPSEDDAQSQLGPSGGPSRVASPDADELRVAGLSNGDVSELPPPPFPHAPGGTSKEKFSLAKLQKELDRLDPPLYAANATSKTAPLGRLDERPALRQHHFGVLTTVLHRCLLEGDYHRAGRAWGMLLRTRIRGRATDPRILGRWGIGAELLLHQTTQNNSRQDEDGEDEDAIFEKHLYTEDGFKLARDYYRRLIVQYPNQRLHPHAIDDRTFYPAMFSLWIYEVNEEANRGRQRLERDRERKANESVQSDEDTSMASIESERTQDVAIMAEELRRAEEIGTRLDEIIVSPPFDKHADLLQLRGMVGLWMGDLILRIEEPNNTENQWGTGSLESVGYTTRDATAGRLKTLSDSRREFEEAQNFLERARSNGLHVGISISNVEEKISEVAKKITELQATSSR